MDHSLLSLLYLNLYHYISEDLHHSDGEIVNKIYRKSTHTLT